MRETSGEERSRPSPRALLRGLPLLIVAAAAIWYLHRVRPAACAEDNSNMPKHKHTNRLINSTSPYLLQHAHNPVDWYPWGKEALDRAKRENKPILVSIGYSACHWCHVMERESFENEDIAKIMNEHFICIKVDREERPDLDEIYMNAVQLMTGSGGWPLNVFLTSDLKPFFGGTYFPPDDRWGRTGFRKVLLAVAEGYRDRRDKIQESTNQILAALHTMSATQSAEETELTEGVIKDAVTQLRQSFDTEWGGFRRAPKFPPSATISLLLRHHHRTGDKDALHMATLTLDRMARGGMYDQLGGGFHRYSVDGQWLVPHFEKMLYDNAQLADVYLEAYQLTRNPLYRRTAEETLDYVLRDMTDEGGGFHSSQDADSEDEEGKYYVWSLEEIGQTLPAEDAGLLGRYYGVTKGGNFEGHNILHVGTPTDEFAKKEGMTSDDLLRRLDGMRPKLLVVRAKRVPPGKDDKILTDWNGLMISAFARGYQVLGTKAYLDAAEKAATFILTHMRSEQGLLHTHRAGRSHIAAYLDDYAFLTQGLIDLYECTFEPKWIEHARTLVQEMLERFWDAEAGGFYNTAAGEPHLIVRTKNAHDSSIPSGNAVAAEALLRLAKLTGNKEDFDRALGVLKAFGGAVKHSPTAFVRMLSAYDFHRGPAKEIAICGHREAADTKAMLAAVWGRYLPNKVVALIDPRAKDAASIAKAIPLLESRPMINDRATAYVCYDYHCKAPVTSAGALEELLTKE